MLRLRSGQIEALDAAVRAAFHRRAIAHLRAAFPGHETLRDTDRATATVDAAMERAADYGITSERDVVRFIDLEFALGTDFPDRDPTAWVRNVLEAPRQSPAERMNRIYDRLARERPDLRSVWERWR